MVKRTPTATLEARGGFDKNPKRREERKDEPTPVDPLGEPPEYFNADQISCWHDIVEHLHPNVAFKPDSLAVEMAAKALAELRYGEKMNVSLYGQFHKFLVSFGMTPADRSKVSVVKDEKADDPWADLTH